ncbi:DUF2142 domain-containing protein [Agromyces sp. G08B096]|uniref:DUF2142 domain-containing protein n=1 Tax=Agromyces sp. G08B096 TaxID=3156399 RepID=A0AAU7W4B0_9MICO
MIDRTAMPAARLAPWSVFGAVFALFSLLMGIWALASPLMAVPDEPAHAIRAAAVVRGQFIAGASPDQPWQAEVTVPRFVAHTGSLTCFAFDPTKSAACQTPLDGDQDELVPAPTSANVNSPAYYAIVGLPTLVLSGDVAIYAMRLVNAVLVAALMGFTAMALSMARWARWSLLAFAVSATPMLLFLGGSINPNAAEIASAMAVFAALVAVLTAPMSDRRLWALTAVTIGSVWMLVNTRSIALLWLVVVVSAALVLGRPGVVRRVLRRPAAWVALAASFAVSLAAFAWYTKPQIDAPAGSAPDYPLMGAPFFTGFQLMLEQTFDLFSGWVGIFGWLDTAAPGWAQGVWAILLTTPVLGAIAFGSGRARIATILLVAAAFLIPPIAQGVLITDYGLIWQARYAMAVYCCMVICAGIALDGIRQDAPLPSRGRIGTVALVLAAFGQLVTFVWVLRRYVVGTGGWADMLLRPEWQPPLGWLTLTVAFAAVLAAGVVFASRALHPRLVAANGVEAVDAIQPVVPAGTTPRTKSAG